MILIIDISQLQSFAELLCYKFYIGILIYSYLLEKSPFHFPRKIVGLAIFFNILLSPVVVTSQEWRF